MYEPPLFMYDLIIAQKSYKSRKKQLDKLRK
nr:MAG TPA: hypothetical protein [Bacteriophage sp.]